MATLRKLGRVSLSNSYFCPMVTCVRHRSKPLNLKYPHRTPHHFEFRLIQAITQPILPPKIEPYIPPQEKCSRTKLGRRFIEENEFEQFLVRQCDKFINRHCVIIICHRLPMPLKEEKYLWKTLKRDLMGANIYGNQIISQVIKEGHPYQNLAPLFLSNNVYIVSENKDDVIKILNILKKVPSYLPLGGVVNGRLVNRADLDRILKLPPIETLHSELVGILNTNIARTSSLLNHHTQTLSANISQYEKQLKEGGVSSGNQDQESDGDSN